MTDEDLEENDAGSAKRDDDDLEEKPQVLRVEELEGDDVEEND